MEKEPAQNPTPPPSHKSKMWLIISLIAFVVIIGAVIFYVMTLLRPAADNTPDNTPDQSGNNTSAAAADRAGQPCGITAFTTEGPYYIPGTAALVGGNLNYTNLPGEPIKINGHVYSGEGTNNPLANAKVEIWQPDSDGKYHPQGNGPANRYTAEQLALRGYVLTDSKGYYEFTSIYPGEYEGRARHIHVKTSADGYTGVTTQLIAPKDGDKVTAAEDSIARTLPRCHTLVFQKGAATFDFHLQ
jgi:protocatechuate 3,4-dioxygenase beta subunit